MWNGLGFTDRSDWVSMDFDLLNHFQNNGNINRWLMFGIIMWHGGNFGQNFWKKYRKNPPKQKMINTHKNATLAWEIPKMLCLTIAETLWLTRWPCMIHSLNVYAKFLLRVEIPMPHDNYKHIYLNRFFENRTNEINILRKVFKWFSHRPNKYVYTHRVLMGKWPWSKKRR